MVVVRGLKMNLPPCLGDIEPIRKSKALVACSKTWGQAGSCHSRKHVSQTDGIMTQCLQTQKKNTHTNIVYIYMYMYNMFQVIPAFGKSP